MTSQFTEAEGCDTVAQFKCSSSSSVASQLFNHIGKKLPESVNSNLIIASSNFVTIIFT